MVSVKLEDFSSIKLNLGNAPYHPNAVITANAPLPDMLVQFNISIKDNASFNLPILHSLSQHHP